MILGAHVGVAEGLAEAPATGRRIGGESIQIFSKSPKMWAGPPIPDDAADSFRAAVKREGLKATAVHHGYLVNLATPKAPMMERSRKAFVDELQRAEKLGVDALIFHPGAHLGTGSEEGMKRLGESLNWAFEATPGFKVRALLENAAGQGTAVCSNFEQLSQALSLVRDRERVGVAIDTCHLFASGVEFRTPESYGSMIDRLEADLGRSEVKAFHLNDAKAPLGSHLDRHENIGKGEIGVEGFRGFVTDPRWNSVPGYLETPLDDDGYARYIEDLSTLKALLPATTPATGGAEGKRRPPRKAPPRSAREAQ
jgi:deoxyribonuclease-4